MKNIGSITSIQYAKISDIDSISSPDENGGVDVHFKAGKSFSAFSFSPETASYSEEQQDNDAGPYFKQSLSFKVPKKSLDIHQLMKDLLDQEFILAIKDGNATTIIMGTVAEPARMSARFLFPASASGYNGYEFSFRANCVDPAPFLDESFVIS